jgi:hypothetical protein
VQSCCVSLAVVSSLCVSFGCGPGQYSILGFQLKGLGFSKIILVSSWCKVRFNGWHFLCLQAWCLLQSFDLVELENDLLVRNSDLHKLHILCTRVCCRHHAWCNTGDHSEYTHQVVSSAAGYIAVTFYLCTIKLVA